MGRESVWAWREEIWVENRVEIRVDSVHLRTSSFEIEHPCVAAEPECEFRLLIS
jgi:hypothetical protein